MHIWKFPLAKGCECFAKSWSKPAESETTLFAGFYSPASIRTYQTLNRNREDPSTVFQNQGGNVKG